MFTDGRSLPEGSALECDVCIVGTGAAGVTTAMALASSGLRLCVLEAGGLKRDEDDPALEVESAALPIGPRSRERYFGGTTNTWWGKMATLDPIDLRPRPWVPLSGWPLEPGDLRHHYRRACALLGMPDLTELRLGQGRGPTLAAEDLDTAVFFWWRRAPRFGELYRRSVLTRPGVMTLLHADVTELVLDGAGKSIGSLRVAGAPGRTFEIRPRATVLAAGGIENPRLLLASRSGGDKGLGNAHDQVGRYYMDHPRGTCGLVEPGPAAGRRLAGAYWSGRRLGSGRIRLGLRLADGLQERLGTLNSYVLLDPVYPGSEGQGTEAVREVYRRGARAVVDREVLRDMAAGIPGTARYLAFKSLGIGRLTAIHVQNFMEQEPRAENRVELSERRDRFGVPLPRVHWSIGELDRRSLRELHRVLATVLERRGIGRLRSSLLDADGEWPVVGDSAHHIGTTRMGTDLRTSVVDRDCRVHDVDNLYVAGSSVFPTGGYANPTMTIMALALRLADHLKRALRC